MLSPNLTLGYSMFEQTGHVFAVDGLKRAGKANLRNMEKITGLEFVPAKNVDKLLLSGKILNAATIMALHYHTTRSGKKI
jgi:hypothetical protein